MKTYMVTHRRDDHNDEWANEYQAECVRTEDGEWVTHSLTSFGGSGWAKFVVIREDQVISVDPQD